MSQGWGQSPNLPNNQNQGWGINQQSNQGGWGGQQQPNQGGWGGQQQPNQGGWGGQQQPNQGGWGGQQQPNQGGWGGQQQPNQGGWNGQQPNQGGWNGQQQPNQGWGPSPNQNQGFNMQPLFAENTFFTITTALNKKLVLDVSGDKKNKNKMIIWKVNNKPNQRFRFRFINGKYQILAHEGLCIDAGNILKGE